eukprot:ctg_881.g200
MNEAESGLLFFGSAVTSALERRGTAASCAVNSTDDADDQVPLRAVRVSEWSAGHTQQQSTPISMPSLVPSAVRCDIDCTVAVTAAVVRRLAVLSGALVVVNETHWAYLVARRETVAGAELDGDVAVVSDRLWYALFSRNTDAEQVPEKAPPSTSVAHHDLIRLRVHRTVGGQRYAPPVAERVSVSLIHDGRLGVPREEVVARALREYFGMATEAATVAAASATVRGKRVMKAGEVMALALPDEEGASSVCDDIRRSEAYIQWRRRRLHGVRWCESLNRNRIYLQVQATETASGAIASYGALVDPVHTTLVRREAVTGVTVYPDPRRWSLRDAGQQALLCSVLGVYEPLAELVRRCFRSGARSLSTPVSVLMHGDRSAQRLYTVMQEANASGVHVCEMDCSLLGYPDMSEHRNEDWAWLLPSMQGATASAAVGRERARRPDPFMALLAQLELAQQRWRDSAPCILYLTRFDAVTEWLGASVVESGRLTVEQQQALRYVLHQLIGGGAPSGGTRGWLSDAPVSDGDRRSRALMLVADLAGERSSPRDLDESIRAAFLFELGTATLSPEQVAQCIVAHAEDLDSGAAIAEQWPELRGLTEAELWAVLRHARGPVGAPDSVRLRQALRFYGEMRAATTLGVPNYARVTWDDIGGLAAAKAEVMDLLREARAVHPQARFRRRSGVLLYGPPGTGKTMLAKAVATECDCAFISVKGPELINMYIGESERNIREVFERARAHAPCIVFFDELDSVAPRRGLGSDSGGVVDRVVAQLLAELDGMGGAGQAEEAAAAEADADRQRLVFVIGATNRPDLLEPALLRPGRFDRMVFLGVAESDAERRVILQAQLRQFLLAPKVDLTEVLAHCPPLMTGADMYGVCATAWLRAAKRTVAHEYHDGAAARPMANGMRTRNSDSAVADRGEEDEGERAESEEEEEGEEIAAEVDVVVTQDDLLSAARQARSSVTADDLRKYRRMQEQFSG